jgi:predicted esterase
VIERAIAAQTHGRYLMRGQATSRVLVGFHGYAESAEIQLERLERIPGSERWLLVSIQGLHRFYERRTDRVVASWMTRQDRELAIADNQAYVSRVLEEACTGRSPVTSVVFAGFSQGVAMAFRAAAAIEGPRCHVIGVGGDVPPELSASSLKGVSSALLCRGGEDQWYKPETLVRDVARLEAAGTIVTATTVPGGHEWSTAVGDAAAAFLAAHAMDV